MKASHAEQKKLLQLHDIDAALTRLAHRQKNLPENAELIAVTEERDQLRGKLARELGILEDARTDLSRIESDVAVVDARILRDSDRLAQSSSVKDVAALESELASLAQRKRALEDAELEVMERVESAEITVSSTRALETQLSARYADVRERKSVSLDELTLEAASRTAERGSVQDALAPELYATYELRRSRTGSGAALFRAGTCGACTMTLTGNELQRVRSADLDDVLFCPECSSIMVRTEESGLW